MSVLPLEIRDPLLYADCFKVPRSVSRPFLHSIVKWRNSSGDEWTVSRLKDIKLDFIRLKAGLQPTSTWIHKKKGCHFSGPLLGLLKWCRDDWKRWSKAIQFLQVYTIFVSPSVTEKQERKFLDGVTAPNVDIPHTVSMGVRSASYKMVGKQFIANLPKPLVTCLPSPSRREPHANGKSFTEGTQTLNCATSFTRSTRIGWDIRAKYRSIFDAVESGIVFDDSRDCDVCSYPNSVGKIGIIQEPGYKLRAVANPARVYQQALKPFGDKLYDILKTLPWDCTHNQSKADGVIQKHLQNNEFCYCVDLSGATDYFPLDLQMDVLHSIFGDDPYVSLFHTLSRQPWRYGNGFIRWTKGQPLGLYPSFASFALTHGLLLYALNGFSHLEKFFILGDDVIILDENLYCKYRAVLVELQCPVSEHKTVISNKLAEFAGNIYFPHGKIPQLKWRNPSDDSFVDIVRNIGKQVIRLLRPRQRKVIKVLSEIPEFMGGLGWNPKGKPLSDRVLLGLYVFNGSNNLSFLMSYNRHFTKLNYFDPCFMPQYHSTYLEEYIGDLDQRSLAYVYHYLPSMVNWYEVVGSNLGFMGLDLDLPIPSKIRRTSNLEDLESKIFKE